MSSRTRVKVIKPSFIQRAALLGVLLYQRIRPVIDNIQLSFFGYAPQCKHSPTCSEYTKEVILKYGTMRGIVLGVRRILSCR